MLAGLPPSTTYERSAAITASYLIGLLESTIPQATARDARVVIAASARPHEDVGSAPRDEGRARDVRARSDLDAGKADVGSRRIEDGPLEDVSEPDETRDPVRGPVPGRPEPDRLPCPKEPVRSTLERPQARESGIGEYTRHHARTGVEEPAGKARSQGLMETHDARARQVQLGVQSARRRASRLEKVHRRQGQ